MGFLDGVIRFLSRVPKRKSRKVSSFGIENKTTSKTKSNSKKWSRKTRTRRKSKKSSSSSRN